MGVFDDSLPDGWGRLLIDRRAAELGISGASLTPLDRLTLVGARSIGALVYEPEVALDDASVVKLSQLARDVDLVLRDASGPDLERLIAVGGSPQGAWPKVLVQLAPGGEIHFGAKTIQPGFTAWIVKFRARQDEPGSAVLEHAYFLMAKAAGIDVPRTRLLGKTTRSAGYFAIERFDHDAGRRRGSYTGQRAPGDARDPGRDQAQRANHRRGARGDRPVPAVRGSGRRARPAREASRRYARARAALIAPSWRLRAALGGA
jgi:serine/threonine-protein kinase HipA